MPKKGKHKFRINRKAVGLTYSRPKDCGGHPITSIQMLVAHHQALHPHCEYIVAKEKHKDGDDHYHTYLKSTTIIDTTNPHYFDFMGVHPNIVKGSPGRGWISYITKDFDFESNCFQKSVFDDALGMATADEAIELLWSKRPQLMCERAHNIEANIRKRMKKDHPQERFFGPYPKHFYPVDWDPTRKSLLLVGPPDVGKTHFARYLLGDNHYIKGSLDGLKECPFEKSILFDEISMLNLDPEQSKEITDVPDGGGIFRRNRDIKIPPGIKRIFCHNIHHPFRDPNGAVYGRRVHVHPVIHQLEGPGL